MKIKEVEKSISGVGNFIKQNPLIVLGVIILIFFVYLFMKPETEEAIPQPKYEPLPVEPPIQPNDVGLLDIGYLFEDIISRQDLLSAQMATIHDALRLDRVEPVVDYRIDPENYIEQILREDNFISPRPRKNDKIWVAEGRWEPVQEVINRQRQRFENALAEGDKQMAKVIRKETELALGQRVEW